MLNHLLLAVAILMTSNLSHASESKEYETLTLSLLTDSDPGKINLGAKTVIQDKHQRQTTTDIVAELLNEKTVIRSMTERDIDATCWLIRALGSSGNARYKPQIKNAITSFDEAKVSKYGEQSLTLLTLSADPEYKTGTISLEYLRKDLATKRAAIKVAMKAFPSIERGQTIDQVFSILGYPDEVLEIYRLHGIYIEIPSQSLQFHYFGLGLVDLNYSKSTELYGWHVSAIWNDIPNQLPAYVGKFPFDAALVMTTDPQRLQELALRLTTKPPVEVELLDRVAERLRIAMKSYEAHNIFAMPYFCRVLGESGNPRYKNILELAAKEAVNADTRRHAKAALKLLRKS